MTVKGSRRARTQGTRFNSAGIVLRLESFNDCQNERSIHTRKSSIQYLLTRMMRYVKSGYRFEALRLKEAQE